MSVNVRAATRLVIAGLAAAALAVAGVAAAATKQAHGLHDARYCEILELKGSLPHARAVVWNTIGQGTCPASWWTSLDAASLAKELGDTVVVLNGPRHFLMDSATAVTGPVRTFHGQRLTMVAGIAIRTAADLSQLPYLDRTIARTNTWQWNRGRTVFELVAPGGDTYVMQSYSQIKDPSLTLAQLRALGPRLALPPGWRYRSRTLRAPLVLGANGAATIIQDPLQDTYQLATTTRPPGRRVRHTVAILGHTREVAPPAPGTIEDHGTLTGTPFGRGSIVLDGHFGPGLVFGAGFRLLFAHGSIVGTASLPARIAGGQIDFRGSAQITGGTGAYRGITSGMLKVHDHNTLDGQHGIISVSGLATY